MAYCTFDQVRAICDSDITDAEITNLITESDAYIDAILSTGSLSATLLQMLSRKYTAYTCMLKDPNARGIGGYSEDRGVAMKLLIAEFDALVAALGGGIAFTAASESLS